MEYDSNFLAFGYESAEGEQRKGQSLRSALCNDTRSSSNRNGNRSGKSMPNTRPELLPEARAKDELTLEAISSRPLSGAA